MSDFEEPASKMSKIEVAPNHHDEEPDDGHEEWLSEGILTDDDYNPNADPETAVNTSQEETIMSVSDTAGVTQEHPDTTSANAETKSFNNEKTGDDAENTNQTEFPEELGAFLVRKAAAADGEPEGSGRSDDDGHDTDELLRMLGEDGGKGPGGAGRGRVEVSSDDDEYIFEGARVARLKVARDAIMRKTPSKAVPEDLSDGESDVSSDEGRTVKRMFAPRRHNVAAKSTARGHRRPDKPVLDKSKVTSTPLPRSAAAPRVQLVARRPEPEEIIDEEEFLEDEPFDLDEELCRPERMEEDALSDEQSRSDDDSDYGELPSSDSDDLNEWFTLDVRAERAGDYIPLLGGRARQLLAAEQARVAARLAALRRRAGALGAARALQADALRRATLQLADLDAALRA